MTEASESPAVYGFWTLETWDVNIDYYCRNLKEPI